MTQRRWSSSPATLSEGPVEEVAQQPSEAMLRLSTLCFDGSEHSAIEASMGFSQGVAVHPQAMWVPPRAHEAPDCRNAIRK
mmetsp:Transcript_53092/g.126664  ORF Transcript_53092/g.126664 Transcript_53092/m.126664 type:complete len:81 (+) Transcript_53092:122-364(+)